MCVQARWIIDTTLRYDRTVWKSNPHLVNGIWCPGGCDGSMPSKGSDSSTYGRAGHVTIKHHQMIRLQNFLFTHLNGNVSTEMVLNRFHLHLMIFDPSLRSQSFQRWPASHVVSCVLRCPKSLMKPPDMLSLVETPRDHPTQTPKRLATVMKNPSFLVKSRF